MESAVSWYYTIAPARDRLVGRHEVLEWFSDRQRAGLLPAARERVHRVVMAY